MPFGSIRTSLRPLKLGFLVDPQDKNDVLQAIHANTYLWGGMYNPIIPVLRRKPVAWGPSHKSSPTAAEVAEGYVDAFDPDLLVRVGAVSTAGLDVGNRKLVELKEVVDTINTDGYVRYGIGLPDVVRHLVHKELRFVQHNPTLIRVVKFDDTYRLFLAAVFGDLPQTWYDRLVEAFTGSPEPEVASCNIDDYAKFLGTQGVFLRRLTAAYIRRFGGSGFRSDCLFLMDVLNTLDIIDYWNLRATGWTVVPVAKQGMEAPAMTDRAEEFVRKNYRPSPVNPNFWYSTTLLKGRAVSESDHHAFGKSLKLLETHPNAGSPLVYQHWYPRIWDEWARDKDGVQCSELSVKEEGTQIDSTDRRFTFRVLEPEFFHRRFDNATPAFANNVQLQFFGDEGLLAEIIPEGGREIQFAVESFSYESWRFSKYGMVYLSRHSDWTESLSVPRAEPVMTAWFKAKGWEVRVSPAGRIANQILKGLGGTAGISLLANQQLVRLLNTLADGKSILAKTMVGEIKKVVNLGRFPRNPHRILERLLEAQVLRLGIEVQCLTCMQSSWHSLSDVDYEVPCPRCLATIRLPSHTPKELKWAYTAVGPFRSGNRVFGAFAVLLTMRFFSQLLDGSTTPLLSFEAAKGELKLEADLALFFRESHISRFRSAVPADLIFVECKTGNHFKRDDADRMAAIAAEFPGSILVFATLRESLTDREKLILRAVARRGRRYLKAERPYNPVLVLTGTELFAEEPPPEIWKEKGGKYAEIADGFWGENRLQALCDFTQQLYLDLPPWHEWLRSEFERRSKGKRA